METIPSDILYEIMLVYPKSINLVMSNKKIYNDIDLFKRLMNAKYPNVPTFDKPREQFLALINEQYTTYYISIFHKEEKNCPFTLGDKLLLKKPLVYDNIVCEGDEIYRFGYLKVDINGIKPPIGTEIWIGVWNDNAFGASTFYAYSRSDIVKLSIEQFFINYPRAKCLDDDIDSLKYKNCLSTYHHDLKLSLVFKKVTIYKKIK